MQLIHPRLALPEIVVVGMLGGVIPEGQGVVDVLGIEIGDRTQLQVPLVGIVDVELEVRVVVLVGLFEHGIFEGVA